MVTEIDTLSTFGYHINLDEGTPYHVYIAFYYTDLIL